MPQPPADAGDLTPDQWALLLSVLSLDTAPAFYPAMQMPVAGHAAFQRALRNAILAARREYERAPGTIPATTAMLAEQLTPTDAAAFLRWARGLFLGDHADQPEWSAWDIVFSHWAYSRQRDLVFLPEAKRQALTTAYRRDVVTDDVKRIGGEASERPLSDWDVDVFARRGFGATWESGPYSIIESIARIERLKRFLVNVWPTLTPAERDSLYESGQKLLADLGVWMPGPLPRLEELPGGTP